MNKNNGKQQLQLAPVAIGQELDVHSLVLLFEECGGNLSAFLKQIPSSSFENKQTFLCRLYRLLDMPNNELFKQRWDTALTVSKRVRLDLLQDKALGKLELYENKSETSSASDIAYAKLLLPEIRVKNELETQQNEMSEQEREAKEEMQNLNHQLFEEETEVIEDKQCQQQHSPPSSFHPTQLPEENKMAELKKRWAQNAFDPYEFNKISKDVDYTGRLLS